MSTTPALVAHSPDLADYGWVQEHARPILARDTHGHSGQAFAESVQAIFARYALAEIALGRTRGDTSGSIVAPLAGLITPVPVAPVLIEAYVSAFLFAAVSTLDATAFAMNALGNAIVPSPNPKRIKKQPHAFYIVTCEDDLRDVSMHAVATGARVGFAAHFPEVAAVLTTSWSRVGDLLDQHSVSKHRGVTATGWSPAIPVRFGDMDGMQRTLQEGGALSVRLRDEPKAAYGARPQHPQLPAGAIATTVSVPLSPIVDGWRLLVGDLGVALRKDVGRLVSQP
ncbi:MAG: hypothetical protein U0234_05270 [Sandaracinus sp.]